jgi:HPt (histidine-containing phosphotransfer) domain-containing protein
VIGFSNARRRRVKVRLFANARMSLHPQPIDWMPSPPLVPEDGPIDLQQLQRMTLGDAALEREVLALFITQSERLMGTLATLPVEAGALAHTLKGSARSIGATRVAECASVLELAIRKGENPRPGLAELNEAVAEACMAIAAMLERS